MSRARGAVPTWLRAVLFLGGVGWVGFCALVDDAGKKASRAPEPVEGEVIVARAPLAPEPAAEPVAAGPTDSGLSTPAQRLVAAPGNRLDVTLELRDSNGLVAGQVVELEIGGRRDGGWSETGTANIMGLAHVLLTVGKWRVARPLTNPTEIEVLDAGQSFTLFVRQKTEAEQRVSGLVTDAKGRPIAEAAVGIHPGEAFQRLATTDVTGAFSFLSRADELEIHAAKDGVESAEELVHPGDRPIRLWLADGALVQLRFSDGLDDAWVRAEIGTEHFDWFWKQNEAHFMPTGMAIIRARHHTGRRLLSARTAIYVPRRDALSERLEFVAGPELQLRAIDRSGQPQQNVALGVFRGGREPDTRPMAVQIDAGALPELAVLSCLTGSDGTCQLANLPLEGFDPVYRVEAAAPWQVTRNRLVKLGDSPLTVEVDLIR